MKVFNTRQRVLFLALGVIMPLFLAGCHSVTLTATLTPTFTSAPNITNPTLALPSPSTPPQWKRYELALMKTILPNGAGYCRWMILGQRKDEMYVWALCVSTGSHDRSRVSIPAVIRLSPTGAIEGVKIPGDGSAYSEDIKKLFPPEVQTMIFNYPLQNTHDLGTPLP